MVGASRAGRSVFSFDGGTPHVKLDALDATRGRRSRRRPRRRVNQEIDAMKPVSRAYFKDLNSLVRQLFKDIDRQILPKVPGWVEEEGKVDSSDAMDDELDRLIRELRVKYVRPTALKKYQTSAKKADKRTQSQSEIRTKKQLESLGIDVFRESPELKELSDDFVSENVGLIASIPSQALDGVEKTIRDGVQQGLRASEIAKQITKLSTNEGDSPSELAKARNRAALIARDQTLTHSAQLSQSRQIANGVSRFIWRTVGDARVRDEHEDREGKEYTWSKGAGGSDPFPGVAINCRCTAEPVI